MKNGVLIIAGEKSGDLHGSNLVKEMRRLRHGLSVYGIGGPRMRAQGVETEYDIGELSVIGFFAVLKKIRFFSRVLRQIKEMIRKRRPNLIILIDYPGFNLKIARFGQEMGVPVLYYISPQVWAWAHKRTQKIAQSVDHLAVIFDFEVSWFEGLDLKVSFVGHPLLDSLKISLDREPFLRRYGFEAQRPILALLPGSREEEIRRILPGMIQTARAFLQEHPECQLALSAAEDFPPHMDAGALADLPIRQVKDTYELMKYSSVMMVASGTATLESAIVGTPFVVVYRVSPLTYWLGKKLIKIENIALANIVAGHRIVPEFIQNEFRPDRIVPWLTRFLQDPGAREDLAAHFADVVQKLGSPGASVRVAEIALNMLDQP